MDLIVTKQTTRGHYRERFDTALSNNVPVVSSTVTKFQWKDTRTGGQNPFHKKEIATGSNATTTMSAYKNTVDFTHGHLCSIVRRRSDNSYTQYRRLRGYFGQGPSSELFIATSPNFSSAENKAIAKFIRRCYEAQRSVQLGVSFGEIGDTLRMMSRARQAFRNGLVGFFDTLLERGRKVRKDRGKRSRKDLKKVVSDTYLEYAFGWRQLVNDVADAHRGLKSAGERPPWQNVTASGFVDSVTNTSFQETFGPFTITNGFSSSSWTFVRYMGAVGTRSIDWIDSPVLQEMGIQLRDFIPTIYNLIPYSFVVDWFTNLGDIIDAYSLHNSVSLRWGCRTRRAGRTDIYTNSASLATYNQSSEYAVERTSIPCTARQEGIRVERTPFDVMPIPSFEFSIPGLSSSQTYINMAALLSSKTFTWRKIL